MKYSGCIGYARTIETSPSVWEEQIVEHHHIGDVRKSVSRYQKSETLNDNIEISNQISIVADTFARQNLGNMRYIWWRNSKWCITSIEEQPPRLILTIGGVYNG